MVTCIFNLLSQCPILNLNTMLWSYFLVFHANLNEPLYIKCIIDYEKLAF